MLTDDEEKKKALEVAQSISELAHSSGFSVLWEMLEENVHALDSVRSCDSFKEMQARKLAMKALRGFMNDVNGVREALESSSKEVPVVEPLVKRIKKDMIY